MRMICATFLISVSLFALFLPGESRAADASKRSVLPTEMLDMLRSTSGRSPLGDKQKETLLLDMIVSPTSRSLTGVTPEEARSLPEIIGPEFQRYMKYLLKSQYVPDISFTKSHLRFLDSSLSASGADVAYLEFKATDGRTIMVAQTGQGGSGSIGICLGIKEKEIPSNATSADYERVLNALFAVYLMDDSRAPFVTQVPLEIAEKGEWIKPPAYYRNYHQYNFGAISRRGVCLVFKDKHPFYRKGNDKIVDPPLPAREADPKEWFDEALRLRRMLPPLGS